MAVMGTEEYLESILERMSSTYDIERRFELGGRAFSAFARCAVTNEKYVLSREANLWRTEEFEYVFFSAFSGKCITEAGVRGLLEFIEEAAEPDLVRKGEKYPQKDHMRSLLTFVLISGEPVSEDAVRAVRRFRYDRGYLFSFRGYAQGRVVAVDLANGAVHASPAARELEAFFRRPLQKQP